MHRMGEGESSSGGRPIQALRKLRATGLAVPSAPKMRLVETLALTPALSPRKGGSMHRARNFHAFCCGIAPWGLSSDGGGSGWGQGGSHFVRNTPPVRQLVSPFSTPFRFPNPPRAALG